MDVKKWSHTEEELADIARIDPQAAEEIRKKELERCQLLAWQAQGDSWVDVDDDWIKWVRGATDDGRQRLRDFLKEMRRRHPGQFDRAVSIKLNFARELGEIQYTP